MKYYDKDDNRIIFVHEKADNFFWDKLWKKNGIKESLEKGKKENFVSSITKKYLKKNSLILEGGCGNGGKVASLYFNDYEVIGIDYAKNTIKEIKKNFSELDVRCGDVRKTCFNNEYFDGYWSLGVIEHFYEGYDDIAKEMKRIIKKKGFLFLTFPSMSLLRRAKAQIGLYPLYESKEKIENFYQFALDHKEVIEKFEGLGFELIEKRGLDGFKGFKDEISFLRPFFQNIYDRKDFFSKSFVFFLSKIFSIFSNHCTLLVLRKK